MIKVIKLTSKDLKNPANILYKADLVFDTQCYPERLFMSKDDIRTLKSNLTKEYKKQCPGISKRKLQYAVGVHWLSLGPNESMKDVIKPGYALVVQDATL